MTHGPLKLTEFVFLFGIVIFKIYISRQKKPDIDFVLYFVSSNSFQRDEHLSLAQYTFLFVTVIHVGSLCHISQVAPNSAIS